MTIGLFAPLPLAMMIPFMAGQSLMMGEAFGKGFQYGKRKISSMSNEQFNALTADDLGKSIQTDYNQIIPHLGQAVKQSSDFQSLVIKEIIDVIKNLPADIIGGFTGTSNPETTSTAASVYGVSGTVTDVRLGGGVRTSEGLSVTAADVRQDVNNIITFTRDIIDDLARKYMQATGLADFERAKQKIAEMIRDKNRPRPNFEADRLRAIAQSQIARTFNPRLTGGVHGTPTAGRVALIREQTAGQKAQIIQNIKALEARKQIQLGNLRRVMAIRTSSANTIQARRARGNKNTAIIQIRKVIAQIEGAIIQAKRQLSNYR